MVKTPFPWWLRWLIHFSERKSFRVLYPQGRWSRPMSFSSAVEYAGIFGGEVRWSDEFVEAEF